MNLLLDTHTFLWWLTDSDQLSANARAAITAAGNDANLSAASMWEIGIKYSLGRLPLPDLPRRYIPRQLHRNNIASLPITDAHALAVADLPSHHKDPFDRLLIAQAQHESLVLVTRDTVVAQYDVNILW